MRWMAYAVFMSLWLVFCVLPAGAHRVMISARVEGDIVYTHSQFSTGRNVKESAVVVYDMAGNQLLEGKTDENGEFSFKVPKKTDLRVALKASMGHMAERTIPAEEITGMAYSMENTAHAMDVEKVPPQTADVGAIKERTEPQVQAASGLSREEIQELIDKSLDRKLRPIVNMLEQSLGQGPKVSEVLGGIGYILGLVGVGLYFRNRGRRK